MTKLVAHFDGRVLVPDKPVNLPTNCPLEVRVSPVRAAPADGRALARLAALAREFPASPASPGDLAQQHDHYLYGTPKKA